MGDTLYMLSIETQHDLERKFEILRPVLGEKARRYWAATEALTLGHGGVALVARATGISEMTIRRGRKEIKLGAPSQGDEGNPNRRKGGGRKALVTHNPEVLLELERLVDSSSRGDPMSPLRWTCKSTNRLAEELQRKGYKCSARTVAKLLVDHLDYRLQAIRKTREGKQHPDRDAQFKFINRRVKRFLRAKQPVLSIDSKKKEKVGDFAKSGREYKPKGQPDTSSAYDFGGEKAIPYGVYDMRYNTGWVNVGIDHETGQFAVESIRRWWKYEGRKVYPKASKLLLVADGGGGNGSRARLWKYELQKLVNELGIAISVSHFPPGTSKWNKIEHRMWNHVTKNWRGRKLTTHAVVLELIANTQTKAGLSINSMLDDQEYPVGIKISDEQMATINLVPERFHGKDWNYSVRPN